MAVQPQLPPPPGATGRDWRFWVPTSVLCIIAALGLLTGTFFLGRASRPSDQEIAQRVANLAAQQRSAGGAKLAAQRRYWTAKLRREKKGAYEAGKNDGYSSGQNAGYSSGSAAGRSEGMKEGKEQGQAEGYSQGFNEGTCYTPDTRQYVC